MLPAEETVWAKTGSVCTEKGRTLADCGKVNGIIRMLLVLSTGKSDS